MIHKFCCIDWWVKVAQITGALLTPAIAIWIGVISSRIQKQQAKTQEQQAKTSHLQHRLALLDRRMTIFDSTTDFIATVLQQSEFRSLEKMASFLRETREHHLLFGAEIGNFINELWKNAGRLLSCPLGLVRVSESTRV
jgi:hypothetical protein